MMSLGLLRSLLLTDPLIILATILFGAVNLVVSFFDKDGRKQLNIARAWSVALLKISRVRVQVIGLEKVDPAASYVFVSNHASFMDTPVVLAHIPSQFRFMAKEELFEIPLLGHHLRRAGHIPVPESDPRAAIRAMANAGKAIRERAISILVFPEGGRSLTGLLEFKEGAAYIAIEAGVPAVPIALEGTLEVLPMGSLHVRSAPVVLRIGDPIPTAGLTRKDRGALTRELHTQVANLLSLRE